MSLSAVAWLAALSLCGEGAAGAVPALAESAPEAPRRVALAVDFEQPELVARVWRLVEAGVPLFEQVTGYALPAHERLVFNLFGSIRGYRRAAVGVGVSGFMEVGAVTSWQTNESYLAVQPRHEPDFLALCGWLPDLLAQLVLHEGVHQFMARAGEVPTIVLPPWYIEGLAEHLTERVLRELQAPRAGGWLMLDDARATVATAVAEGRAFPLRELFGLRPDEIDRLPDRALFYDQSRDVVAYLHGGSSERWSAALSTWRGEMERHEKPADPVGVQRIGRRHRERWLELVGDLDALERDWKASVRPAAAAWREVLGSSQYLDGELVTTALEWQEHGYALAAAPAPASPRVFSCELALLREGHGEAYVVLHAPEGDEGGLKLTLRTGPRSHRVALVGWRGAASASTLAAEAPALAAAPGFVPLRVEIDGRELAVRVGDDPPLRWTVPDGYPAPGGHWGLGAWHNAARWRGPSFR